MQARFRQLRRRLFNGQNLVHRDISKNLVDPAGPFDVDLPDDLGCPEPKVNTRVAPPVVAAGRCYLVVLLQIALGGDPDLRPDAHSITLSSNQLEENPVVPVFGNVMEVLYLAV